MTREKLLLVLVFIVGIMALSYEGFAATRSNLNEKIHELTEKLTATTTGKVIDVDSGTVYINLGEKDSIYPGSLFEVVKLGDVVMVDGKPYYKEKTVGIVEVTRVRGDYSLAKIVAKAGPITKNCRVYQITSLSPSKLTISLPAEKTVQQVIAVPGVDIKSVYRRLDKAGFSPGPFSTKHLGQLSAAIKRFQKMAHLSETGVVDSSTWEKMRKLFDPGEGDLPLTEAPEGGNTAAAPEIEKTVRSGKPCKIVLMEFNYDNSYNNLTKNIYESLSVALIQKGFQVVERSKLDQVLKEQKLATTGLIDLSTAQKIGQLAGGNVVLVGTVSDMGNLVAIRARMVDVEKGVALTAAEVTMDKTPDIAAALEQDVTEVQGEKGNQADRKKKKKGKKKNADRTIELDGFKFVLNECKKSETVVTCYLKVTNLKRDRTLDISSGGSRMYDNFGYEYKAGEVALANRSSSGWIEMRLIKDVSTIMTVTFNDVAADAEKATVLDLHINTNTWKTLEFRDFPFTE